MSKRRHKEPGEVSDLVDLFSSNEPVSEMKKLFRQRSGSRRPEHLRLEDDSGEPTGLPFEDVIGGVRKLPLTPDEVYW